MKQTQMSVHNNKVACVGTTWYLPLLFRHRKEISPFITSYDEIKGVILFLIKLTLRN